MEDFILTANKRPGPLRFPLKHTLDVLGNRPPGHCVERKTLDRFFLEDPEALVPGVRMGGVRLRDPGERRTLIRWLQNAAK